MNTAIVRAGRRQLGRNGAPGAGLVRRCTQIVFVGMTDGTGLGSGKQPEYQDVNEDPARSGGGSHLPNISGSTAGARRACGHSRQLLMPLFGSRTGMPASARLPVN